MRSLFFLLMLFAPLMPPLPEVMDVRALIVACVTGLLLLVWFVRRLLCGSVPRSLTGTYLFFFLCAVALSLPTAILFDTDFDLWLRGAIPFMFLAIFFPAYELAAKDPSWVLRTLGLSAIVWFVVVLKETYSALPLVLSGAVLRITHATEAWLFLQLPYAMVGLALMLFHPPANSPWVRWPLAIGFTALPLLAASRGQIAAVAGIWMVYALLQPKGARLAAFARISMVVVVFSVLLAYSALWKNILTRFSDQKPEESPRVAELNYAISQFLDSPLLGKGLGHQIPAEITFLGNWPVIQESGVTSVGYMHNVVGYLLMDLGLVGLLTYGGFVLVPLKDGWAAWRQNYPGHLWAAAVLALVCLLLWSMVQASFRLIQSNLLVATLSAVLAANRPRRPGPCHA